MKAALRGIWRSLVRDREQGWLFAAVFTAAYAGFLIWGHYHHESWRDEMHPWALAKRAESFWDIVTGDRVYDGHPPLWYWYLRLWSKFTTRWWGIDGATVLAMSVAALLFLRYAPFSRPLKLLLLASYLLGYEYGVMSRNYTMGWLMLTVFCSVFHPLRPRFVWLSIILGLLAITSVYGTLMACALFLLLIRAGVSARIPDEAPGRLTFDLRPRFLIATAIMLASLVFFVYTTAPPEPNPYSPDWNFSGLNTSNTKIVLERIVMALLPVRTNGDLAYWSNGHYFWSLHQTAYDATGVALVVLATISLAPGWTEIGALLMAFVLLSVFQLVRYGGTMRHIGNFFLFYLAIAWIRRIRAPHKRHILSTVLLVIIGAFQLKSLVVAAQMDREHPFSGGRETAALIEKAGLQDLPIVAGPDAIVLDVTAFLGRTFISSETEEVNETMVFHSRHRPFSDVQLVARAVKLWHEKHSPVLVISNRRLPAPTEKGIHFTLAAHNTREPFGGEESFWAYKLE